MGNTMTYEELEAAFGPEVAAAHRRKVQAMRAAGLHPDQVFGPLVLGGQADRSWWSTMAVRSDAEDWLPPWVGELEDEDA